MRALALVDFDNIPPQRHRLTSSDIEMKILDVADAVTRHLLRVGIQPTELNIRLYGGWLDIHGNFTTRAQQVVSHLASIRGLRDGVRLLPHLSISLAAFPDNPLVGTFRIADGRPSQKMVDTMLSVDAVHLSDEDFAVITVVSDDDDLLPAAVTIARRRSRSGSVHLLRSRSMGEGINDGICTAGGGILAAHGIKR